jgi:YD repeat-containing protein
MTTITDPRSMTYTNGDLTSVTDPEHHVTTYAYDAAHRLTTITDGRGITYLTNTYTNGRVTAQALADPAATFLYSYTTDGSAQRWSASYVACNPGDSSQCDSSDAGGLHPNQWRSHAIAEGRCSSVSVPCGESSRCTAPDGHWVRYVSFFMLLATTT